ncbi:MAG: A/G-specific adenine glycosylase [Gemmatimonadota bacterium]
MRTFASRIVAWQRAMGRRDLPWQGVRDPYRVWLSEIMLQQTQVATVVPYYLRFVERFPDVVSLAHADSGEVMRLWAGLGYYARARNLHACARQVVAQHGGAFPRSAGKLADLPGIGRSTAAAIAAFCFDERAAILDGNVKRVLTRQFGVQGDPRRAALERLLWARAESLLPDADAMPAYTQGLMDLGATVCVRSAPRCDDCPVRSTCVALRAGRVDELPAARPRRAPRLRFAHLLLLVHEDRVLLEQRPGAGIWGGLLSLPQFDRLEEMAQTLTALAPAARARPLPTRRHAFTHFTLQFTPHLARIEKPLPIAMEPRMQWLAADAIEGAALPAPMRTLLLEVMCVAPAADAVPAH